MDMQNNVLIACAMMEFEINKLLEELKSPLPVVWMDRGLHDTPDKMRKELQKEIDKHQDKDYILLGYGLCGNGILRLRSPHSRLVIPKFDDCIRILLALEQGSPPDICASCFYLTNGWMEQTDLTLTPQSMENYIKQYGEKKGRRIIEALYGNYTGIRFIDLPTYQWQDYLPRVSGAVDLMGFEVDSCPGSLRVLKKFLTGAWDEEFCLLEPKEEITYEHFEGRII